MRGIPGFEARAAQAETMTLPRDSLGFVRRECPACHRPFKILGTNLEGQLVFERLSAYVAHANPHEADWPEGMRTCPYCSTAATDDQWFTAEQRAFLDRRAEVFGLEIRFEQLAHVERTLAVNPWPTYLPVRPGKPDPELRAEPDDMRLVPLLCCREEIKIAESWTGSVWCFFCGTEHDLGSGLIRDRLARLFQ